jgi:hypothetical protein
MRSAHRRNGACASHTYASNYLDNSSDTMRHNYVSHRGMTYVLAVRYFY